MPAFFKISANCCADCVPISKIMSSAATSSIDLVSAFAFWANSFAVTTSTGKGTTPPFCAILSMIFLASSTKSASAKDLPIGLPCANKNVLAIPPPTIKLSTLSAKLSKIVNLVETLLPATIATNGCAGCFNALPNASNSPAIKIPAHATGAAAATASVEASARCAVPNASFTKISHKLA